MLHGFTVTGKAWNPLIEDLSKKYRLIVPDLRGHGYSTNPSQIYNHKLSAVDMYGLMDRLNINNFNAIGQSGGAMALIHMATMDTTRISKLILVGGTPYLTEESRKIQRISTYEYVSENEPGWMDMMMQLHPGGEQQIRILLNQFRKMANTYDELNFTPPYLNIINCPTLIIHGDRDPQFPIDIPILMYKSIPDSYLWIVPNDGHTPAGVYDQNSIWSEVNHKVMADFFDGNWSEN